MVKKKLCRKQSHIRFLDSLNFLAMPLSKMPSTFNLTAPKGTFLHYFNMPENEAYVGSMPDRKYYGEDRMMPKARIEFLK